MQKDNKNHFYSFEGKSFTLKFSVYPNSPLTTKLFKKYTQSFKVLKGFAIQRQMLKDMLKNRETMQAML